MSINDSEVVLSGIINFFDRLKVEDCPNRPIVDAKDNLNENLIRQMESEIKQAIANLSDEPVKIFEDDALLTSLIASTGGNKKTFYILIHDAVLFSEGLPVNRRAIGKARGNLRHTMTNSVDAKKWILLAKVHADPHGDYDSLPEFQALPRWSILKYEDAGIKWHRVHPLLVETTHFREAVEALAE